MGTLGEVCYWKELWRLTSVFSSTTCNELVTEKLKKVQDQLEKGLCFFKPSSSDSFSKLSNKQKRFEKALHFVEKLQQFLNLDSEQCWDIFSHYLSNQYHGQPQTALQKFSIVDIQINQLLLDVASFYHSERMFMLKQLKLILEYKENTKYVYGKEFNSVIKNITFERLKKSLLKQFDFLVKEVPPSKSKNGDLVSVNVQRDWLGRNLREQVEVLSILLLVIDECSLTVSEFKELFLLFKAHNFGRQPTYAKVLEETDDSSVLKIVYCEVAIFYKIINDAKGANIQSIIQHVKDDVEGELIRLKHNEEHGALLLAWMLLLLQDSQGEELFLTRYQHFGTKALQLRVFEFLFKMTAHTMFSDNSKCAKIFRKSVYRMMSLMCDKFDGDGSVAKHPFVIELCNELLSDPAQAQHFWSLIDETEAPGLVSLWNTGLEYFPYDFKTLSIFITGLAKAGDNSRQMLLNELNKLPVYTELYKPRQVVCCSVMNDEDNVILTEDYYPCGDKVLEMKSGSQATILDRRNVTLIHFRTPVSYWRVLQNEMHKFLDGNTQSEADHTESIERVLSGIRALVSVLKGIPPGEDFMDALAGSCETVFDILVRYSHSHNPPVALIAACMDVSVALIPKFTQKIYTRLKNTRVLPAVDMRNLTHIQYANGESFQTHALGLYLVNIEQPSGEYKLLSSYLDLLLSFYDCNYDSDITLGALLPGLVFVLKEIFPHLGSWFFKSSQEKQSIEFKCINYLFKILQLSSDQTSRPADLLLNKICVYSLLNVDNGMALLKSISIGESRIQSIMENETNWISGPGIEYIRMIQISMSVLMQVLRLKSSVKDSTSLGHLEQLIYTQPKQKDALKIIPIVTGYMNHVFNKQLPNTACRLLRRFALEFHMSLLVCLDMSPNQIRTMFLERLRDETESTSLKTVILEFVSTCIEKQPGLTEAFFVVSQSTEDTKSFVKQKEDEQCDGILIYMAEYLSAVKDNTSSLYSPMLCQIMGLFHALWKNNMQMLVKDLRENPDFWEYLCSPLFQDILPDIRAYSQIFNMISIELFLFEGKVDKSLQAALSKLFSSDGKYLKVWVKYIMSFEGRQINNNAFPEEVPSWLSLLTSWKDFVTIIMKHSPCTINTANKWIMVKHCVDTLNLEMESMSDARTIVILSEIYAILFSNWKEDCFDDRDQYLKSIAKLLNFTSTSLDNLHHRAKSSILAISTLSLNLLSYDLIQDKTLSNEIICSVSSIISQQLDKLSSSNGEAVPANNEKSKLRIESTDNQLNPTVLGLKLLELSIYVFKDDFYDFEQWLTSTRLINKLVFTIAITVQKKQNFRQSLAAFNCLSAYARTSSSHDLLNCDISQRLWLQLLPPKELLQSNPINPVCKASWQASEWRQLFKSAIEFVSALLMAHGPFFSSETILFIGVQEEHFISTILLIRQTLDIDILNSISGILCLISELLKYQSKWQQEHPQSMGNLMRCISVCFHYCITMLLRPKEIISSVDNQPSLTMHQDETENPGPSPKVVIVLNKLLELIHLSACCLKSFSPDLLSLIADPTIELHRWQPLVELQFGTPKLTNEPFPTLTFGTIMSAISILTRALNCGYHPEETPLNNVRRQPSRKKSPRRRSGWSPGSSMSYDESSRRRALRSDSVTSVSSTTSSITIGPGWLSALDRRLVLFTLENILCLLASQAFLAVKDPTMSTRDKQLIRRELCTELPIFHDFVRKKVLDISHPKNYLSRKKYGTFPLLKDDDETKNLSNVEADRKSQMDTEPEDESSIYTPPAPSRRSSDSMRVSVVRKLHLDKARTKTGESPLSAKSPSEYLPILDDSSKCLEEAGTSQSTPGSSRPSKHVTWDDISALQQSRTLDPDNMDFCPLSEVQIIEEDYLHFISNLFLYFCQTDH